MPRLSVWMVRAALLHLGAGITLGALMLWHKGVPVDARLLLLRPLHVDLLLTGWLMQFAPGVAFWILPRFSAPPKYGREWLGWAGFGLLNAGILTAAFSYGTGLPLLLPARLAEVAGLVCFAVLLYPRVKPYAVG